MSDWDDDDENEFDDYGLDESDDETGTVKCSSCGIEVYEEAEQCPSCGDYIVHSTSVWDGKPIMWVVLGLAGIFAVILVLGFVH
jgi:hypothetical protein